MLPIEKWKINSNFPWLDCTSKYINTKYQQRSLVFLSFHLVFLYVFDHIIRTTVP